MMTRSNDFTFKTEYIKSILYFATLNHSKQIKSTPEIHYFTIDNELVYENYFSDFGPLNLGCVYKYCMLLSEKLKLYLNKQAIVHYTSPDPRKAANAAFLMGCYGVLHLGLSPKDALKPLTMNGSVTYPPFQDATEGESIFTITILDCLKAIKKARDLGFFNFKDFNYEDYNRLDKLAGGDLNWIVPGKFLAFIGPVDVVYSVHLYHPPEIYTDYFLENDVKMVIRLNKKLYDGEVFKRVGIAHYDLFFPDGSCPPKHILLKFLQISEDAGGAVAVHCKGWLEQLESWLTKQGNLFRKKYYNDADRIPVHPYGVYSIAEKTLKRKPNTNILAKGNQSPPPPIQWDTRSGILSPPRPRASKIREAVNKPPGRESSAATTKDSMRRVFNKGDQKIERGRSPTRRSCEAGERVSTPSIFTSVRTVATAKTGSSSRGKTAVPSNSNSNYTSVKNVKGSRPINPSPSPLRTAGTDNKNTSQGQRDKGTLRDKDARNTASRYDRLNRLCHALTVTPHNASRLSPLSNEGTTAMFSTAASRGSVQTNPRRRLGRSPSPSPPPTRVIEHTRATNTPNTSTNTSRGSLYKDASKTSLQKALSRLKYGKISGSVTAGREGSIGGHSFGAGSLGARREAPAPTVQRSPRVRSDERAIATQGDMLNCVKFQRRLQKNDLDDKFNVKCSMSKKSYSRPQAKSAGTRPRS